MTVEVVEANEVTEAAKVAFMRLFEAQSHF